MRKEKTVGSRDCLKTSTIYASRRLIAIAVADLDSCVDIAGDAVLDWLMFPVGRDASRSASLHRHLLLR